MAKIKINGKDIEELQNSFNQIYSIDPTLEYLKQFEEEREKLSKSNMYSKALEIEAKKMEALLGTDYLKNAFGTSKDYENYSQPLLEAIYGNDYKALQEVATSSILPNLKSDYEQILKSTELFSDSLAQSDSFQLDNYSLYNQKIKEALGEYNTDKLGASQKILDLASSYNTDTFQAKLDELNSVNKSLQDVYASAIGTSLADSFNVTNSTSQITDSLNLALGTTTKIEDSISALKSNSLADEPLPSAITGVNKLNNKNSILDDFDINTSLKFEPIEMPKIEDSPIYKQNEKLIHKSDKQIEVTQELSTLVVQLNQTHETQVKTNDKILVNSHKQIEIMTLMSNFMASQSKILEQQKQSQELQNKKIEEQISDNKKSSKIALWTAIISIILGTIISLGGAYLTYYVYVQEDISDNNNHAELIKAIEKGSDKVLIRNILTELKELNEKNKKLTVENLQLNTKIKQNSSK